MTLQRLWAVLAVALPVLGALIATMSTVDLAYQLRAGAEILDGLGIPRTDRWTYTVAGQPWHDQQWGAQVLLALAERLAGWTGLAVTRALLVGTAFGLVAFAAVRRGVSVRTASLLALAAFLVSAVALGLRPQLFGIVLFALTLVLIGERRRTRASLWLVVPVTAVWANVHGSFVLAPVLLGLAWLEDLVDGRGHQALVATLVAAAAATLNPWGLEVWSYVLGLAVDPDVRQRVTEWQPTTLADGAGWWFYGSGLAVAALIAVRGRRPSWPVLLTLATFFALGVITGRGVAWWPMVAAAVVAGILADGRGTTTHTLGRGSVGESPGLRRLNSLVVAVLGVASIVVLPMWRPLTPGTDAPVGLLTDAPPGVTGALRDLARPGDRLFAPQVWGSWFEYVVPAATVAVDSRIELFGAPVWEAVDRVIRTQGDWLGQLDTWGVTIVVARRAESALIDSLVDAGWRDAYADGDGSVLVRADRG